MYAAESARNLMAAAKDRILDRPSPSKVYIIKPSSNVRSPDIRHLIYDEESHWKVLTEMYGSVWPKVLPFCIFNVAVTLGVYYLKYKMIVDLSSDVIGHKYLSSLMAFLVVTRVKITYDNAMHNAQYVNDAYKAIRELVQHVCTLTAADQSPEAIQWRREVTRQALVMLRVTMAILEVPSRPNQIPWKRPELSLRQQSTLQGYLDKLDDGSLAHLEPVERTTLSKAGRMPIILAHTLREEILRPRYEKNILKPGTWQHPCNEEIKLLDDVADFLKAFAGLKKLYTTPLPFPFVQMSKTLLFFWVFTLPVALCHDFYSHPITLLLIIFLITFGFIGLEFVAIELSDAFGNDPGDFDHVGYAELCYEDCYISLYKTDGIESACMVKDQMTLGLNAQCFEQSHKSGVGPDVSILDLKESPSMIWYEAVNEVAEDEALDEK